MDLANISLVELSAMPKDQIIFALTEDKTETKTIVSIGDKRGQLREARETRNVSGNLVSSQEVLWTYFKGGNVDTITIIDRDGKGVETKRQVVKHGEGMK